jgi:hypothetical protein
VKCAKESLNLGDVFLLDLGLDLYVWMPPESGRLERLKGMDVSSGILIIYFINKSIAASQKHSGPGTGWPS